MINVIVVHLVLGGGLEGQTRASATSRAAASLGRLFCERRVRFLQHCGALIDHVDADERLQGRTRAFAM